MRGSSGKQCFNAKVGNTGNNKQQQRAPDGNGGFDDVVNSLSGIVRQCVLLLSSAIEGAGICWCC